MRDRGTEAATVLRVAAEVRLRNNQLSKRFARKTDKSQWGCSDDGNETRSRSLRRAAEGNKHTDWHGGAEWAGITPFKLGEHHSNRKQDPGLTRGSLRFSSVLERLELMNNGMDHQGEMESRRPRKPPKPVDDLLGHYGGSGAPGREHKHVTVFCEVRNCIYSSRRGAARAF